jgi:hypothetical protein
VYAIFYSGTRPDRVTWWLLSFLNFILCIQSYQLGATWSIFLPAAYTFNMFVAALLSVNYGSGKVKLNRLHVLCILGTIISLLLWYSFNDAFIGLVFMVITDFIGIVPTIVHTYKHPNEEDFYSWASTSLASVMSIFSLSAFTLGVTLYPAYLVFTNFLVLVLIIRNKS